MATGRTRGASRHQHENEELAQSHTNARLNMKESLEYQLMSLQTTNRLERMAMADTDKSILRALPVTAVFLDVHQRCVGCPRNATQHAKLATMQDKIEAQDERSSRIKFIMYA